MHPELQLGLKERRNNGEMMFNPCPEYCIKADDTVIALGEKKNLLRLEKAMT